MVQTHDVMMDGAGYMLVPGTYRYESAGANLRAVRTGVPSFEQRLAAVAVGPVVVNRDATRWTAYGMLPVPVGLGDESGRLILAPAEQSVGIGAAFDTNSRGCVFNGVSYLSLAQNLYKITTAAGRYSALTFIGAAPGAITSMAVSAGLLYLACAAPATTMANYAGSGAIATSPAVKAQMIWDYARGLWRSKQDAGTLQWDTASGSADGGATWTDFRLDSTIKAAVPWRGRATGGGVMLVATQAMLWELAGQWAGSPAAFSGTVSPVYDGRGGGGTDDFTFLIAYQGHIYTQYAGTIHRWDGARLEPVPGAPRGVAFIACVAGGYLCVSTADGATGQWLIWVHDGVRWAILARSGTPYGNLFGTGGVVADGHLFSLNATTSFSRWEMPMAGFTSTPRASGSVTVGPLDAGQGDAVKTWTQISVAWSTALYPAGTAAPANPGGNLLIEYSVDDGSNFVLLGTAAIAAGARSGLVPVAIPAGGVAAQRLLTRVTWTPTSTYAGLQFDGVWASGWQVGDVPKKEQWQFTLRCTDKLVRRDGSVDARSGETMLGALRSLAQSGRSFAFQDTDYDLSARTVTARVTDLTETERKGDGTHFLESRVALTLATVA